MLSDGRLLPAGGLGVEQPGEIEAMGVARGERAARLEESVAIIKALWTGEPVTHRGRFWSLTDVTIAPRPRRAKLELWLGGLAPAALRRIGRIADGWLGSFVGPEEFGEKVELIRASAAEAGRTIDEDHYGTTIFSAPSTDEIPQRVRRVLAAGPSSRPRTTWRAARRNADAAGAVHRARGDEVRADPDRCGSRRRGCRAVAAGGGAARGARRLGTPAADLVRPERERPVSYDPPLRRHQSSIHPTRRPAQIRRARS